MAATAFAIGAEAAPPRYAPRMDHAFIRENFITSYSGQNAWMSLADRYPRFPSRLNPDIKNRTRRRVPCQVGGPYSSVEESPEDETSPENEEEDEGDASQPQSKPPPPILSISPNSQYFEQYMRLMNRMAYRYPNPGPPTVRSGNVGASWRHIRQVLGYRGNTILYIDGVVGQFDTNHMNQELAGKRPPNRVNNTPLYAINKYDVNGFQRHVAMEAEKQSYKPWLPSLPPGLRSA